jgi:GAF domain-containing protein
VPGCPLPCAHVGGCGHVSRVRLPDVQADPEFTWGVGQVEPLRTLLGVPMLKDDELVGVIVTQKREVKPFTDKQIALVEAFADQAVIAIENATRLLARHARENAPACTAPPPW